MIIGIDLDNTIILYDELFHLLAVESKLIPTGTPPNKTLIRDHLRTLPDGEEVWTALQAEAYGPRIGAAKVAPGFPEFVLAARSAGATLKIISHKTERAASNPAIDLRESALRWLEQEGFFTKLGFARSDVRFESTRADKIAAITELGPDVFVDDLIEVFAEQDFPKGCRRLWYTQIAEAPEHGAEPFRSWGEIRAVVFGK